MPNTPRAAGEQREQFEQAIYELQWAARELGFQVGSGIDATGKQRHVAEVAAARQALLDLYERAAAEIRALESKLIASHDYSGEVIALRAELAALRQDREAVEWLEQEGPGIDYPSGGGVRLSWGTSQKRTPAHEVTADTWRAAIDAARQAGRTAENNEGGSNA